MGGKNKVGLTKRIYHFLKKQIELKKYKGVETYELKLRAIEVVFSTADAYSKGWFFPRYDKGKQHEPPATNLFMRLNQSIVFQILAPISDFSLEYLGNQLQKEVFIRLKLIKNAFP